MASSGVGLYHGLWGSYAHDPAYRRDPDTMGDAAICWVKGILPPQPEKIDADGTLFFRDFFKWYYNRQLNNNNIIRFNIIL